MNHFTRRTALSLMGGALAMPYVSRARAEGTVNVYNWADYIGETTIEDFQKETGISVNYDNYSSAEEMQAKMMAGSTGYDVVVQAGVDMPTFIKAKIYDKLDKSKLPGWANLDPQLLSIFSGWDPGNEHAIPYMWGTVGFTFNVDMVKERIPDADFTSMDLLLKPENAAKLADCGISILDSPGDILPMVLRHLGKDGDSQNPDDYKAVIEAFKSIRENIRTFDNVNFFNAIPNKELCVINSWSGNFFTAKQRAEEAGVTDLNLAYFVPKTGAPAWFDCLCIPADAKNKDNAHKFLDYMLRPEVAAACTNYTYYASGNHAARKFIDKTILESPAVYPDAEAMKQIWAPKTWTDEQSEIITRAWTEIKSG